MFVVVDKSLKSAKETMYESQIENIKSAASMWSTDNIELIPNNDYYVITLGKLEDDGYIKETIENPKTKEIFSRDTIIKINMKEIKIDDTLSLNDIMKDIAQKEIELLKTKASILEDGVYYYDDKGNLERFNLITSIDEPRNYPMGSVLISNHQVGSVCLNYGDYNYWYYKDKLYSRNFSCSTVRGENLVINGDLSYGNNMNFPDFTYNNGYLSKTSSSRGNYRSNGLIQIDINKSYEMGLTAKTSDSTTLYYLGFTSFDIDGLEILNANVNYFSKNTFTLTKNLNKNDEYIYLDNLTNWNKTTNQSNQRGFIFWNYIDSTGYQYPEFTYSRNVFQNMYINDNIEINVNVDGEIVNRIKLTNKWNGPTIKKGTKLSQSNDGSTFNYNIGDGIKLGTEFKKYSTIVSGIDIQKFRPGTKYIRFLILDNYSPKPNVTSYYKDFYIKEITE